MGLFPISWLVGHRLGRGLGTYRGLPLPGRFATATMQLALGSAGGNPVANLIGFGQALLVEFYEGPETLLKKK